MLVPLYQKNLKKCSPSVHDERSNFRLLLVHSCVLSSSSSHISHLTLIDKKDWVSNDCRKCTNEHCTNIGESDNINSVRSNLTSEKCCIIIHFYGSDSYKLFHEQRYLINKDHCSCVFSNFCSDNKVLSPLHVYKVWVKTYVVYIYNINNLKVIWSLFTFSTG